MNVIKLPKLTARGKKGILHFRPSYKGKQLSWVNLGTSVKREASRKAKRFMQLLELEGPQAALCDLKGISAPEETGEKLPITDLIDLYKDFNEDPLNLNPVTESTLETYIYTLKKIAKVAEAEYFQDLNGKNIIALTKRFNPDASNATIGNNLRHIRAFVKPAMQDFLKGRGYEVKDPFGGQQAPKVEIQPYEPFEKVKQREIWDDAAYLPNAQTMIVKMALGIGLRRGEIEHAKRDWFFEHDGSYFCKVQAIDLENGKKWKPKWSKERIIPIKKALYEDLITIREDCSDYRGSETWMIPSLRGGVPESRLNSDMTSVLKWLTEKGIKRNGDSKLVHILRKQYGSVIASKYGIYIASKYLGHASVKTTEKHYVGLFENPVGDIWN